MFQETWIGIDLGTTNSAVGYLVDQRVEMIENSADGRLYTTPSVVAYSNKNGLVLAGTAALNQKNRNPLNTVYDVKRLIGRRYDEPVT